MRRCLRHPEPTAPADLQDIPHAETKAAAIAVFTQKYRAKYAAAAARLTTDTKALPPFVDFPAEHRDPLRTANPVESVFATVRHRTVRPKRALSQKP